MQRRWIDRGLVAAALVLVAVILAGALSHVSFGGHDASPATTQPKAVPAPPVKPTVSIVVGQSDIELHGSPETEFLRHCRLDRLGLDVVRGQRVAMRYDGPPCHVPRLELTAVVRDPGGRVVSSRPALNHVEDGALPNVLRRASSRRRRSAPAMQR